MKAYSLDLRERIAAACAQAGLTVGAVAARFSGAASFVAKRRRRQRQSGSLAALPHRSGPAPSLDAAARSELAACLRQQPDAPLDELRVGGAALGGPNVSPATTGRAVQALDRRRKKRASTPPSATPPA